MEAHENAVIPPACHPHYVVPPMRIQTFPCVIAAFVFLATSTLPVRSADWPMARFDANRSGASPVSLPANLHLQWVRTFPRLAPAWPDQAKMQFDIAYVPVVLGRTMFLGS